MTDAERYRRAGALCIYAAQQEAKDAARALLVAMAEKWLSLAHLEEITPPPPDTIALAKTSGRDPEPH
jgi:hypothetical protein